jgi:hypothetical protein
VSIEAMRPRAIPALDDERCFRNGTSAANRAFPATLIGPSTRDSGLLTVPGLPINGSGAFVGLIPATVLQRLLDDAHARLPRSCSSALTIVRFASSILKLLPRRPAAPHRCTTLSRAVVNAIFYIFYIALSGCQWRMLPKDFPPIPGRQRPVATDQPCPADARA